MPNNVQKTSQLNPRDVIIACTIHHPPAGWRALGGTADPSAGKLAAVQQNGLHSQLRRGRAVLRPVEPLDSLENLTTGDHEICVT